MTRIARAALLAVACGTLARAADWTIVRRTTVEGGTRDEQTEYWSRKRLVVDDPTQRTIVDFGAGTLTSVDKDERTYFTMPLEKLRRQLLAVGAILDRLPPAARDLAGLDRKLSLTPNGNETTLAGHRAREYLIAGEGVTGWVWLADDLDPTTILGDEAAAWWKSGGPLSAIGPLADVARAIAAGDLRGMPMWANVTAGTESRATSFTSEVVSVREGAAPADVARVPDGYRKESAPLGD